MQAAGLPEGEEMRHVGLETKFKIAVSLFQVVGSFPFTLSITYPPAFTHMLSYVKIIFLDIIELIRVDCFYNTSLYVNTALAAVLLPGIIVLLFLPPTLCLCTQSGRQAKREGTAYQSALNRSFFAIFMLYPYLSKTSFRAFACRDLDEGESYHQDYYEVDCHSDDYILFSYFSFVMLFAFPVGVPAIFFVLLYANRQTLKNETTEASGMALLLGSTNDATDKMDDEKDSGIDSTGLPPAVVSALQKRAGRAKRKKKKWWQGGSEKYSFLTRDYKPEFYYFECIELVRKMLLAGAIIFFSQGSVEQAFAAGIISFFFFAVYARAMPFRGTFDV
eukprot:COSAG02_NODE_27_length_51735_cov_86.076749_27_plen_333_part_00